MQRPDRGRLRALLASSAAFVAMLLAAVLIPSTSSAFTALITNTKDTTASKARFVCADTFAGDRRRSSAYFEFGLMEAADATTAADSSAANDPGTYRGSNAKDGASPIACPNDVGAAYLLDGSSSRVTTDKQYPPIRGTFSEEVWFKTSSKGKLIGFESGVDGGSEHYDKHIYVGESGHLIYGAYNGGVQTLTTPGLVNDGSWHYVVATTGVQGSVLYLDGVPVASDAGITTAEDFSGYWRIGAGSVGGWPDQPQNTSFTGSLRFAAAYPYVLTADEVASAWSIGKPGTGADSTKTASPTATASPASTDTPAPTATAAPTSAAAPVSSPPRSAQATSAPASSDISTAQDQTSTSSTSG